eukprot:TRINITY_DN3050_c0_g1_i9.p1 TRINITY_DN3050_c0_g1~~TRINITY_DN3050_c0_g1_i9.p1  ORF type:complete len:202 (+),score=77.38 TRINITY_DN3050_c0_g1_i9:35-640(+)
MRVYDIQMYSIDYMYEMFFFFFFQAEDGIRDAQESRGLGDVYKRQVRGYNSGAMEHHTPQKLAWLAALAAMVAAQDDTVGVSDSISDDRDESTEESDPDFVLKIAIIGAIFVLLIATYVVYTVLKSRELKQQAAAKEAEDQRLEAEKEGRKKEPAPPGWYAAVDDKSGRVFFHNTVTKERCWRDPRTRESRREFFINNLED